LGSNSNFNDEIINYVFEKLKNESVFVCTTFLNTGIERDYDRVQNKWYKDVRFDNYEMVFVPIHSPNHWVLAVVYPRRFAIECYDSMGGRPDVSTLSKFFAERLKHAHWELEYVSRPLQTNSYDCGSMICLFAKNRIVKPGDLDFGTTDVLLFKQELVAEINCTVTLSQEKSDLCQDPGDECEVVIESEKVETEPPFKYTKKKNRCIEFKNFIGSI